jgi:tRNA(Ile)-lysidine synthase
MASSRKSRRIDPQGASPVVAALTDCLLRRVRESETLTVGLSGGADSVVLLHALAGLRPAGLSVLHVHHGLSPHADRWADFCAAYARSLGLPFATARVTVERGAADGLEAAARRARHAAFAAAPGDWIVLAHHRDDQAETVLFNLLRGSGIAGAAAMRECSGRLLRPLLGVGRADILGHARANRLDWIEDESNADLRHARNFLRHRILVPLLQRFPAAARNLAAAAARFAEAQDLLDALARTDLGACADFPIPLPILQTLDEARARNVLRYLLARHRVKVPSEARLREICRQILSAAPDRQPACQLGEARLTRRRGRIYLVTAGPSTDSR